MSTRQLISDNGIIRKYRVLNDAGQQIGTDEETVPTPEAANEATIRNRIAALLTASVAYLAVPNPPGPTAAQTTAQVQRNTRLTIALAKLALGQLDTTEGT
jgi:hypothetical protein